MIGGVLPPLRHHVPRRPELLKLALTHRSYLQRHRAGAARVQRAARVPRRLGARARHQRVPLPRSIPNEHEGQLTKTKSLLVSKAILSRRALAMGLGRFVLMSHSEVESGGRQRLSILADAFESVIGAIYLDQGFEAAREFITRWLLRDSRRDRRRQAAHQLQEPPAGVRAEHLPHAPGLSHPQRDGSRPLEAVQRRGDGRPAHARRRARGRNKKEAEQAAARNALEAVETRERRARAARARPARGRGRRGRSRERASREPHGRAREARAPPPAPRREDGRSPSRRRPDEERRRSARDRASRVARRGASRPASRRAESPAPERGASRSDAPRAPRSRLRAPGTAHRARAPQSEPRAAGPERRPRLPSRTTTTSRRSGGPEGPLEERHVDPYGCEAASPRPRRRRESETSVRRPGGARTGRTVLDATERRRREPEPEPRGGASSSDPTSTEAPRLADRQRPGRRTDPGSRDDLGAGDRTRTPGAVTARRRAWQKRKRAALRERRPSCVRRNLDAAAHTRHRAGPSDFHAR